MSIISFGIFLRFYRFEEFVTFLGDQGRDAIIIKRIITGEHFPAIGPPSSVGQVYLGPFYYYFIAPWLLFFNFNPLGLAFGVCFFSSLFIIVNYLIVKELFDQKTALISSTLVAFSFVLIDLSRFSWNPNLLPLFSLINLYFFIKSLKTHRWYYFGLTGAFLSFCLQLHYVFLFSLPGFFLIYLFSFKRNRVNLKTSILNFSILLTAFFLSSSPLLIFDLRHNFLNTKNFLNLISQSRSDLTQKISNFLESFFALNQFSFNFEMNKLLAYSLIFFLSLLTIVFVKKEDSLKYFLVTLLFSLIFMSFFSGKKHPHYFASLYPLYFVIIANFFSFFSDSNFGKATIFAFVAGFIFLNFQKYPYFRFQGDNQINKSRRVAFKIKENVKREKFTITSLPEQYSDSTYRYFLEIWDKKPIEKNSLEKADELFVVCEGECSTIIGNPQWDIAYFAPTKIIGQWEINNTKIYKLIR